MEESSKNIDTLMFFMELCTGEDMYKFGLKTVRLLHFCQNKNR